MTAHIVKLQPEPDLPQDLTAERYLLGALMLSDDAPDLVQGTLTEGDFYHQRHGMIFAAAMALWARGVTVDQVTVAAELGAHVTEIGLPYLQGLTHESLGATAPEHYARIVRDKAVCRRAIQVGSKIVEKAYTARDVDGFLAECEGLLGTLTGTQTTDMKSIGAVLEEYWSEPGVLVRDTRMLRFGMPDVDAIVCGVERGNFMIVAARPSMGKSTLLEVVARNAAVAQQMAVTVITMEMNRREWAVRLMSAESHVSSTKIRDGNMNDAEQRNVYNASMSLGALPISVRDRSGQTVERIRAEARRAKAAGGLDLLVVDYLQLIGGNSRQSRYEQVTEISRSLKILAGELDIVVIAAAQLNREADKRKTPRPQLSDLRDSGGIEQDADQVILMYRADKYVKREDWRGPGVYPAGLVELIVGKNRHGPTGSAWVRIDDATGRIDDVVQREAPGWAK